MNRTEDKLQQQQQIKQNEKLQFVIERNKEMMQSESDIINLNHMFKEIATMVDYQGEMISKRLKVEMLIALCLIFLMSFSIIF